MNAAIEHAMSDRLVDLQPGPERIMADVLAGLSASPKRLPSKYFYDARGSELFERITREPEYYLTRVETALLESRIGAIAAEIGPHVHVVEYGSGNARKTEILLQGLPEPVAYTPIEISSEALLSSVARLDRRFGDTEMLPVCADFTRKVDLPRPVRTPERRLAFFPGSTLGNFEHADAAALLSAMRSTVGHSGLALIGIDLDKDPAVIAAAYNDAAGVTADFTLNLLHRLNRDIGSDFAVDAFAHQARYSRTRQRIETTLVARRPLHVHVGGSRFDFAQGEAMQVEYSHKYTDGGFAALAGEAGWTVVASWNDPRDWFGLRLLQPA